MSLLKLLKKYQNYETFNNLAYVGFMKWLEIITISHDQANKMMKIVNEFPNGSTSNYLGTEALYLIATLQEE